MKTNIRTKAVHLGAIIIGTIFSVCATASADTLTNSVNEATSPPGGDWTQAIWTEGNPPAIAVSTNDYLVGGIGGVFNAVRTINTSSPQSFAGHSLILTNGGGLLMKNTGGACNANLILDGGQIIFKGGGSTLSAQLGGTLQVNLNPNTAGGEAGATGTGFYNLGQDQTGANTRNILLQANVSGSGNLIVNMNTIVSGSANTVQIAGTNTVFTGNWTNNQGTLEIESSSVNPLGSGAVTLSVANNTFLNFNSTNDLIITNSIFGTGSVGQFNTNTVILNGTNAFTGKTTVSNGVLRIGANSSITNSTVIALPGGTLDVSQIGGLVMNSLNSQLMTNCNGKVIGNLTVSTGNTLNFNLTPTTNEILNVTGSLTLNGNPNLNLTLNGSKPNGTYRLINYTNTSNIQGGGSFVVTPPAGSSEGFALDTSTPGQVNLVVTGAAVHNLTWVGDGSANIWDTSTPNWTGNATVFSPGDNVTFNDIGSVSPAIDFPANVSPGSITVSNTAKQYTIGDDSTPFGIVTSSGLTKLGTNELDFFTPGNQISGPIDIESGILSIGIGGSDGSLGTGAITNNGILQVNLDSGAVALNSPISGSGSLNVTDTGGSAGATVTIGGNGHNSYTGLTTIGNQCQLNIATSNALGSASTGTIVQGGRLGVVSLVGVMTIGEPVTISGTGVSLNPGALYVGNPGNNVTWAGPITIAADAQIRGVNNSRMNFANAVTGTNVALECSAGALNVPGGSDASTTIFFESSVSLGSSGSMTMDGVGTVILDSPTNVWGGGTTVSLGTLRVGGTLNGGNVIIGDGTDFSTLTGTGIILGPVTVASGSLLFPGSVATPIGTLTVSNSVTLDSGCTNLFELNRASSPNSSRLVANSLLLGGTLNVVNVGAPLQAGDTFALFSNGSTSGSFAVVNLPVLSSPLFWNTSSLNSGTIKVASNTAPTPNITSPSVSGSNFILQVAASQSGFNYVLQAAPALAPPIAWTSVQTNAGTGGTLNFTNLIVPGSPQQFFRISVQ